MIKHLAARPLIGVQAGVTSELTAQQTAEGGRIF